MKKVWTYFAIGCVVAIIGMFFSDICGDFFNGMDYGSACVLAHYGGLSQILCKHRNAVQIEQNLFKAEVAQAAAALFSK